MNKTKVGLPKTDVVKDALAVSKKPKRHGDKRSVNKVAVKTSPLLQQFMKKV